MFQRLLKRIRLALYRYPYFKVRRIHPTATTLGGRPIDITSVLVDGHVVYRGK